MDLRLADRGQSAQVGAVILFGFLIIGLSLYQATVVPEQNRGVEFNAYQEASEDMIDLQNDVIAAAGRDVSVGTTIRTGVSYPARAIFVNPGPPDNRVTATAARNVTLENVTAVDGEATNTRTFVATALSGTNYSTRDVAFRPDYNVFGGQPVVVTGQQAYRHSDGRQIPLTGQSLLQGDRLTLTFVEGDVSAGGDAVALTTDPVSATERTVTITGENDDPIRLRLDAPPGISASEWVNRTGQSLLANPRVDDVSATAGGRVEVTLNGTRTYELRMAQLEVRERNDASAVGEPGASYVIPKGSATRSLQTGARTELAFEVRDRFNNPVSGATVELAADRGEFLVNGTPTNATTVTTNEDGAATVVYSATDGGNALAAGADAVDATVDGGGNPAETATIDIGVTSTGAGTGPSFADLQILDAVPDGPSGGDTGVIVDLRNRGTENITITGIRIDKTSTGANRLKEDSGGDGGWNREVFINVADSDPDARDANDGNYEAGDRGNSNLAFGTQVSLDNEATIRVDERGEIYLYEFRGIQGQGQNIEPISMDGQYLRFTIFFETEDGTQDETTATVFVF
ncbi:hypothetical protein GCM10027435_28870 [Haloparvum alkalitolerans]|uniref:hypothetical protein n=1 Tax=Haloparvum alkalitolerans TaxID=1042953 RepID=UPI003CE728D3